MLGKSFSTRETVWCETPATRATSAIRGGRMAGPAPATGRRAIVSGVRSSPSGCGMRASYGAPAPRFDPLPGSAPEAGRDPVGQEPGRPQALWRSVTAVGGPETPSDSPGVPTADDASVALWLLKIHRRIATNRTAVATRLAAAIATVCAAAPGSVETAPTRR